MKKLLTAIITGLLLPASALFADNRDLLNAIQQKNDVRLAQELEFNKALNRDAALLDGKTALMLAAETGWTKGVEILLSAKAEPNKTGPNGDTALLLAVRNGADAGVITLLINGGANINARNDDGDTALLYAVKQNSNAVLDFLLSRPDLAGNIVNNNREDALIIAVQNNNTEGVGKLLKTFAPNLSHKDKNGKTSVVYACEANDAAMIRLLIESGRVDFGLMVSGTGVELPLLLWVINTRKNESIIEEIINHTTEPLENIVDRQGRNAMDYAVTTNNRHVQFLLRQKMTNEETPREL
jgi:ankyrin repeat protein